MEGVEAAEPEGRVPSLIAITEKLGADREGSVPHEADGHEAGFVGDLGGSEGQVLGHGDLPWLMNR